LGEGIFSVTAVVLRSGELKAWTGQQSGEENRIKRNNIDQLCTTTMNVANMEDSL